MSSSSVADAKHIHDEWDRRTRQHDVEGLVRLYRPDATLESPLVPVVMGGDLGIVTGHSDLRRFFSRGTRGRPNEVVRFHRSGQFMFDGRRLMWEYPRWTPEGDQVDIVEVMDIEGPLIREHRIYWGWFGTPLLRR